MTDDDYITRTELQTILTDLATDLTANVTTALRSVVDQLVDQVATRAHLEAIEHRYTEDLAVLYGVAAGNAVAVAGQAAAGVAREATERIAERLASSIVINVPPAPAPTVLVENSLELPARTTTTSVVRDKAGLIKSTTAVETDV